MRPTGISFSQFHEWKGYTKNEELNGGGPKNEAPNQRGIKIKPLMERVLKIFGAYFIEQNKHEFVAFHVNFRKAPLNCLIYD